MKINQKSLGKLPGNTGANADLAILPSGGLGRVTGSEQEVVLLAVTGMSPAILTETIWALAHPKAGDVPVIPARIIVITTMEGRERLKLLFQPAQSFEGASPWEALRFALEKAGHDLTGRLRFGTTADDIRVITVGNRLTGRSAELTDIRSREDNEAAGDFILETVRSLVENPDLQLIASIAGGRKTMGSLMYACLSLAGRETDRLTHVLVNSPYETLSGFYFPGQPGGGVLDMGGKLHPPLDARVELAVVPFVSLRNLFQRELGRKAGTFSRLVQSCRENVRRLSLETLQLVVHTCRPELTVNGQILVLAPTEHLLFLFLAWQASQKRPAFPTFKDAEDSLAKFKRKIKAEAPLNDFSDWRQSEGLENIDSDEEYIRKASSRIREKMRRAGGDFALLTEHLPVKGRCSLNLPASNITIR